MKKTNEDHEKIIRDYLEVHDSLIVEYEPFDETKYYVTLLIDTEIDKRTLQVKPYL